MTRNRTRLPNRRCQILEDVDLVIGTEVFPHTIGIGMYGDGRPGEVFIKAHRKGEFLNLTNDDFGVLMSSLLQLPLIAASSGKTRPIGMITADDRGMGNDMLLLAGVETETPIIVKGMQERPEFKRSTLEMCGTLDSDLVEEETVAVARELLDEHPDLAAILLECSELPPYARAVQAATGVPTYDFITMIDYLYAGTHRTAFEGSY